tara:strand:- start:2174 stop:2590 length:417 start_codon:yes stop_codon:yes gene_type:complete
VKVQVSGLNELVKEINRKSKAFENAVDNAVVVTANAIRREAVLSINKQTRGDKTVKRGKKKHYISPEGGPPNSDTGTLVRSINVNHIKGSQEAIVFSSLDYAAYLEFVLNRPWLSTASEGKDKLLKENILMFSKKALL